MAAQFKNLYTTLSTSSSTAFETKDLLTCPVGKTILIRTVHHHNSTTDTSGNNHSMHALWFRDYSSNIALPLTTYMSNYLGGTTATIAKGAAITLKYPLVMEENDELKLRISEPNQDISLSYVELDAGVKQRYKAAYITSTSSNSASGGTFSANVLLAPAGTTYIVNFIMVLNPHSHTQEFKLTVKDNSANITKTLWNFDFSQNGLFVWQQAIVLEASDQLATTATWDTDDSAASGGPWCYISYLEIRNPPIRA